MNRFHLLQRVQTLHVRMFHITIDVDITCLLDRTSTWKLVLNNLIICWHQKIVCICQLLISLLLSSYGGSVFLLNLIKYWDDLWCLAFSWIQNSYQTSAMTICAIFGFKICYKIQVELDNTESCLHKVMWVSILIELCMKSLFHELCF